MKIPAFNKLPEEAKGVRIDPASLTQNEKLMALGAALSLVLTAALCPLPDVRLRGAALASIAAAAVSAVAAADYKLLGKRLTGSCQRVNYRTG